MEITNCLFCRIIKGEIKVHLAAENDYCLAFLDINPASQGHTLIITKKHYENIIQVEQNDWNNLLPILSEVTSKLKKSFQPQGFNFISNMGEMAYQSIFHFHLHIIPKYQWGKGFTWTVRNNEQIFDLAQIAKKIESK